MTVRPWRRVALRSRDATRVHTHTLQVSLTRTRTRLAHRRATNLAGPDERAAASRAACVLSPTDFGVARRASGRWRARARAGPGRSRRMSQNFLICPLEAWTRAAPARPERFVATCSQ